MGVMNSQSEVQRYWKARRIAHCKTTTPARRREAREEIALMALTHRGKVGRLARLELMQWGWVVYAASMLAAEVLL
jgi:hypothetical protein